MWIFQNSISLVRKVNGNREVKSEDPEALETRKPLNDLDRIIELKSIEIAEAFRRGIIPITSNTPNEPNLLTNITFGESREKNKSKSRPKTIYPLLNKVDEEHSFSCIQETSPKLQNYKSISHK